MVHIKKFCSNCGSEDVVKDAWVSWNESNQEYEIHSIHDNNDYCNQCEQQIIIKEQIK